jgi:hypothetical protein
MVQSAMANDQQGLRLAGSPASAAAFDRAVADYWGLTGDPVGGLKAALAADPGFALGGVAIAGLFMIGGFRGDHPEVLAGLAAARPAMAGASARERRHLAAAEAWAAGQALEAALLWENILTEWPTDALALRFVQDAYFFLGQSLAIRDSAARALQAYDRDNPIASFVLGAYAFGLEEAGDLGRAEECARMALEKNPRDAWATHALAHVMETACRQDEGVAFLRRTRSDWAPARFMAGHNGWHLALYLIEQGRTDEVLADYDRFAAPRLADDTTLDRIDAASLLWRLELIGVDVGDRWGPVARAWMAHTDDHVLAFNDLHCAFAAGRSPDPDAAARFCAALDSGAGAKGAAHTQKVMAEVGRRLVDGVLAYAKGDDAEAIAKILPLRYDVVRIGGSHAQRDIVALTLIAAAQRSGRKPLARALLAERLALRPTARSRADYERSSARSPLR